MGEAVGGVVDGDDRVRDDPVGVRPRVAVAGAGEGCAFDELQCSVKLRGFVRSGRLVGLADVVGEVLEVALELRADVVDPVADVGQVGLSVGIEAECGPCP